MTAAAVSLIIGLLELAVREFPAIKAKVKSILDKDDPTASDWQALRTDILGTSYKDVVTNSQLPE